MSMGVGVGVGLVQGKGRGDEEREKGRTGKRFLVFFIHDHFAIVFLLYLGRLIIKPVNFQPENTSES